MNRHARLAAAAMLLLVFGVGALTGMAVEEGFGLDWFDFLDEDERVVDQALLGGLDLSSEQQERIAAIQEEQERRLESYWRDRVPELRSIVDDADARIRAILTPEQRATFDERIRVRGARLPDGPD